MKKSLLFLCSGIILLGLTGCEDRYDLEDAKRDMINYLEEKYDKKFEVNNIKKFYCSGGLTVCEYRGEANIIDNTELKCEVDINYDELSDDCEKIIEIGGSL